jgi:hypothetical protein
LPNCVAAEGRWAEAALAAGRQQAARGEDSVTPWRPDAAVGLARTGDVEAARELIAEQWLVSRTWNSPASSDWCCTAKASSKAGERDRSPSQHGRLSGLALGIRMCRGLASRLSTTAAASA